MGTLGPALTLFKHFQSSYVFTQQGIKTGESEEEDFYCLGSRLVNMDHYRHGAWLLANKSTVTCSLNGKKLFNDKLNKLEQVHNIHACDSCNMSLLVHFDSQWLSTYGNVSLSVCHFDPGQDISSVTVEIPINFLKIPFFYCNPRFPHTTTLSQLCQSSHIHWKCFWSGASSRSLFFSRNICNIELFCSISLLSYCVYNLILFVFYIVYFSFLLTPIFWMFHVLGMLLF